MKPLSCLEVLEQIELYATGECDETEKSAIRQHLAHCPACFRAEQEARAMLGLLDLRLQEPDRLRRLQARLCTEEGRPRSVTLLPFARRIAAIAAMLLLAVGLSVWFRVQESLDQRSANPIVVALGSAETVRNVAPAMVDLKPTPMAFKAEDIARIYSLDLGKKTAAEFRQAIETAKAPVPEPPQVNLSLELRNATDRQLKIHVGGEGSELKLDLVGPGVVTAPGNFQADFLTPKTISLKPGQIHHLDIRRLVYGSRGNTWAAYWTKPGDYMLKLRYKVGVSQNGKVRFVKLQAQPVHVQVQLKKVGGGK
jgi:hypothetical protein